METIIHKPHQDFLLLDQAVVLVEVASLFLAAQAAMADSQQAAGEVAVELKQERLLEREGQAAQALQS